MNLNRHLKPAVILCLCLGALTSLATANPEIVVEQPAGTELVDGGTMDFGTANLGANHLLSFTIRNTGTTNLTGLAITKEGTNAEDFTIWTPPPTSIVPSGSVTFTVSFAPAAIGIRNAVIRLASNDADENPFDVILTGTGAPAGVFDYRTSDGSVAITGYNGPGGAVVIPGTINGQPVTGFEGFGFTLHSEITSVAFPASMTSINSVAYGCTRLTAITVDAANPSLRSLDGVLFDNTRTTLIWYPGGKAGPYAVPSGVTTIGNSAFSDCPGLTSLTIPASVAQIQTSFWGCASLDTIAVDAGNPNYSSLNGVLFNKDRSTLIQYPAGKVGAYAVPAGVTSIGGGAFDGSTGLTSVTIPASVTSIGNWAFMRCSGLTVISVDSGNPNYSSTNGVLFNKAGTTLIRYPAGLVGAYAVPSAVTGIDHWSFSDSFGLTSVTVPASVTESCYFFNCTGLTTITVDPANPNYSSVDGVLFNRARNTLVQCPGGKTGIYMVPAGVTTIGDQAFHSSSKLTSVILPSGVTIVENEAFSYCTGLDSLAFMGNAPTFGWFDPFELPPMFSIYYYPSSTGFSSPLWHEIPTAVLLPEQEIAVGQTGGTVFVDGVDTISYGNVAPGDGLVKTVTIRNTGSLDLTRLAVSINGSHAADFSAAPLGLTTLSPGATTTLDITFSPSAAGSRTATLHLSSNDGDENSFDLQLAGTGTAPNQTVSAGINLAEPGTVGGGKTPWFWQPDTTHDGIAAARSGAISHNESSSFSLVATGPGTASFWWKVSSESGFDHLHFHIDGLEKAWISGNLDWRQVSFPIAEGTHTLRWTYSKDDVGSSGADCGWVDQVVLPGPVPEIAVEQPAGSDLGTGSVKNIGGVAVGTDTLRTFFIKNTGTADLTGLAVTKDGTHAADFTVGALGATTLAPGTSTTFGITFTPGAAGSRTAAIHIASNDSDENPFDINLSGVGLTPQETWRQNYFGTTANTGTAANIADPDKDGLNNLLEFAFGLHPTQPSAHLVPKWQQVGGNLTVSFTQPAGVGGITYGAEWSPSLTLGSWQPIADTVTALQHNFTVPIDGSQRKFVRFGITSGESAAPDSFALIPAGPFQMGDQSNPVVGYPWEMPVHTVQVSAFYMGKYEVTKEEWDAVRTWGFTNGYTDLAAGNGGSASKGANHPVHSITWYDMVKWCNARSQMEGFTPCYTVSGATYKTGSSAPVCNWSANGYRLPTEAEWEKAARGGVSAQNFPWGNTITHSQANYCVYSSTGTTNYYSYDVTPRPGYSAIDYYHPTYAVGGSPYSSPVGSFAPNGYGLYDMAGNMWELCWDWYGPYAAGLQTDPRGAASGSDRVFRGGCWSEFAGGTRCAFRSPFWPGGPVGDGGLIGFRLARGQQ